MRHVKRTWQVVIIIWHKVASPLHTNCSIIFARWRQSAVSWCAAPCNTRFLGPTQVQAPNGISIGWAIFAQLMAVILHSLQWVALFLLKNCLFAWGSVPRLIHNSLSSPESQTARRSVQSCFQGWRSWQTDRQTDRQTDHATSFVTVGHVYLRSTAIRPNKVHRGITGGLHDVQVCVSFTNACGWCLCHRHCVW